MWKNLSPRIASTDAYLSLADRFGVTSFVVYAVQLLAWSAFVIALYLWSTLPWYGLVLVGLTAFAILAYAFERVSRGLANLAARKGASKIDRQALADEAEALSAKILSLAGEHYGAIQAGWFADCSQLDEGRRRKEHTAAVGKLIERYSERYAGAAWRIINTAKLAMPVPLSTVWHVQHGARSDMDVSTMGQLLAQIAAELRHGNEHE